MIAVLIIGIIGLIALIAVLVGIGILFGFVGGALFAIDEIMDDPYLRVAALRALDEHDSFYTKWCVLHGFIKEKINEKL